GGVPAGPAEPHGLREREGPHARGRLAARLGLEELAHRVLVRRHRPRGAAAYFNKDAVKDMPPIQPEHRELREGIAQPSLPGSRMKAVDRDVYDVLLTDRLAKDLEGRDLAKVAEGVKAAHFTGNCLKPWSCLGIDSEREGAGLCMALHAQWWGLWNEVAAKRGGDSSTKGSCSPDYVLLPAA
ncbi:unnamed protein product, partial [Prorocentrum cordatum]